MNAILQGDTAAILELTLAETISAYELRQLLTVIDEFHFASLWLDLAERSPPGQPFPDEYSPKPDEILWVTRLEIGTPNKIQVRGPLQRILALTELLALVLGGPHVAGQMLKDYAEFQKARVEIRKLQTETELLDLDIVDRAYRLHREGKISSEALEHKLEVAKTIREALPVARGIITQAPKVLPSDQSIPAEPDIQDRIESELQRIGKPDAAPFLADYRLARADYIKRRDQVSQDRLQLAYERLKQALTPISDQELHGLLEQLDRA